MGKAKFKIGDTLRCKPGYNNNGPTGVRAGALYKPNLEFVVSRIEYEDHRSHAPIYWSAESGLGVFEHVLEFVRSEVPEVLTNYQIY